MKIAEHRDEVVALQGVGRLQSARGVAGALPGPGRDQSRNDIRHRTVQRLRELGAGRGKLTRLDGADGKRETREAVVGIDGRHAFGQSRRLFEIAARENDAERAVEKLGLLRRGAERGAEEGRGGIHVAKTGRRAPGQIIAGGRCRGRLFGDFGHLRRRGENRRGGENRREGEDGCSKTECAGQKQASHKEPERRFYRSRTVLPS